MIDVNEAKLVPHNRQLLSLLAQGCSNKEIARFTNCNPRLVKQHLRALFLELLVATKTPPDLGLILTPHQAEMAQTFVAPKPKAVGYGLPCLHCRAYYPADMNACPICKSSERVPPNAVCVPTHACEQTSHP